MIERNASYWKGKIDEKKTGCTMVKLCHRCGKGIPKLLTERTGCQCIECENCGNIVRGEYDYWPVEEWNE